LHNDYPLGPADVPGMRQKPVEIPFMAGAGEYKIRPYQSYESRRGEPCVRPGPLSVVLLDYLKKFLG
jgi:hypothetical protein